MKYEEWQHLTQIEDKQNPAVNLYKYEDGSMFYVEPPFYTQLRNLKAMYPESFQKIIIEMEKEVKRLKKVVFVYDFKYPFVDKDDFVYIDIHDLLDKTKGMVEDKSRGSNYGD